MVGDRLISLLIAADAAARAQLQPVPEQNEDQQDRRNLVEVAAAPDEGSADTDQIAGADAEDNEHRHIGTPATDGAKRGNDERPG